MHPNITQNLMVTKLTHWIVHPKVIPNPSTLNLPTSGSPQLCESVCVFHNQPPYQPFLDFHISNGFTWWMLKINAFRSGTTFTCDVNKPSLCWLGQNISILLWVHWWVLRVKVLRLDSKFTYDITRPPHIDWCTQIYIWVGCTQLVLKITVFKVGSNSTYDITRPSHIDWCTQIWHFGWVHPVDAKNPSVQSGI